MSQGPIPSEGTNLGCRFHPRLGEWTEATDVSVNVSLSLSLSPRPPFPLPFCLKLINVSSGEEKNVEQNHSKLLEIFKLQIPFF